MRGLIFLSLPLAGCHALANFDSSKISEAEAAVRSSLPNPTGARFGSSRVAKPLVCGQVDVMNTFGEYPGFRPFAYHLDTKTAVVMPARIATRQDARDQRDFPKECLTLSE